MSLIADTRTRVETAGSAELTEQVRVEMLETLAHYAARLDDIEARLSELDKEWDIERALEANAATLGLVGALLAVTHDRRWVALPMVVGAFLLQHAIRGWCPPLPVLRRLGFRTQVEIERERMALKALRGDFRALREPREAPPRERAEEAYRTVH